MIDGQGFICQEGLKMPFLSECFQICKAPNVCRFSFERAYIEIVNL